MHLRGAAAVGRLMPFNSPRPKVAIRGRCVQVRRRPPISKEADLRDYAAGAASCLNGPKKLLIPCIEFRTHIISWSRR